MKIGKVPENVLKRAVFKQIHHRRQEVLLHPGVGEDCAAVAPEQGEVFVLSTDPITGADKQMGIFAVHITANDLATAGAEPIGILSSIILPPETEGQDLRRIMSELEQACDELQIEILGGHTEVSDAVNRPVITVTGVGKVARGDLLSTGGMQPGDELVMTKWPDVCILSSDYYALYASNGFLWNMTDAWANSETKNSGRLIDTAESFQKHISVVPEAKIAMRHGVHAMHDVTEGGIFGALWEMGAASGVGIVADLDKIPIRQETIELCEVFDINPYLLISSGCMLIGCENGNLLVERLQEAGIPAAVIGRATEGNDRVIRSGEETRFLEPAGSDELYKIYE